MPRKQVTIADIAKACGTSTVTVSKALCGRSGVSEEVRAKIRETADKMGYVSTKSVSNKFDGVIGVLIPNKFINPNGSFYWALYNDILKLLKSLGISCIQENIGDEEESALAVPNLFSNNRVTGVISLGQLSAPYLRMLANHTNNLVLLDYYAADAELDCVVTNGYHGGYLLAKHLIALGHKEIGFIGTRTATTSIFDRFMGYLKAMLEHGLEVNSEWIIPDRPDGGAHSEHLEFPERLPTAFVCNCDETAFVAIRELKARGLSVPRDISVVGYDNYLISEISDPPITTIQVDSEEMAREAISLLFDRIDDPARPKKARILTGNLVVKESTRAI
ncbi:MAG: LacI family DNA-binding transcriptional regulator [Lachnospiraceae bacterium]|nr:LacI family DNA-binding transcriptional regulator [Ruminococcus sp.]MCM1274836.1 LacI family DNA-binding transcriptional regulator [Lachnospiraceae bacterium]